MPARHTRRGRPAHPDVLTPTEWRVLDAIRHGMPRREIAARRGVSVDAIRYHARNIAGKLGVASVRELRTWPGQPAGSRLAPLQEDSMSSPLHLGPVGQVSLFARDTARAERFYRDTLGLRHIFTFGDLAFFDADGLRLYVHTRAEKEWRPSSVLYFVVADLVGAQRELESRGVRFTAGAHLVHRDDAAGTEEWMAFFEDSEGNMLALMSRVAAPAEAATSGSAPVGESGG
jgi:DNA-binding CsgD family transcriptional regulator/catechol 2,3-dioxygenase-like lactoylglutathione lyase family enzyme